MRGVTAIKGCTAERPPVRDPRSATVPMPKQRSRARCVVMPRAANQATARRSTAVAVAAVSSARSG